MIRATQVQQSVSVTRTMTDKEARFESSMFRRECRNGGRLFFSNSRTQYSRLLILNPSFEIQRAGTVKNLLHLISAPEHPMQKTNDLIDSLLEEKRPT